jgi:hypothetical protein
MASLTARWALWFNGNTTQVNMSLIWSLSRKADLRAVYLPASLIDATVVTDAPSCHGYPRLSSAHALHDGHAAFRL